MICNNGVVEWVTDLECMETSTALLEEAGNGIHGGAADLRQEDQEGALVVFPY